MAANESNQKKKDTYESAQSGPTYDSHVPEYKPPVYRPSIRPQRLRNDDSFWVHRIQNKN